MTTSLLDRFQGRRWFEAAGVTDVDLSSVPTRQFGPQVLVANAAIAGQGIAMLTPTLFADAVARRQLIQPFDLTCDDGMGYWLVYPESRRNAAKIKRFRSWLESELVGFDA